jgi:ABC-type uncharacterized transport system ATPase subunit
MEKIVFLLIFTFCSFSTFAKKVKMAYVDSYKFTEYFPKEDVKETSLYKYNKNRGLKLVFTVKSDSIVDIRYNIDSKEKTLYLKRDTKKLYCIDTDISQKKFDKIIKDILNTLNN